MRSPPRNSSRVYVAPPGAESDRSAPRNSKRTRARQPPDDPDSARAALRRFFSVSLVFLLCCCVPYLHSSMADYRYLGRIDARPLLRAVTLGWVGGAAAPDAAIAGLAPATVAATASIEAALALDPALMAPPKPARPAPAPAAAKKRRPEQEEAPKAAKIAAKPAPAPRSGELPLALHITDASIGDHSVFFEDPERAMDPFYEALVALAWAERAKVRIRHYGDSHIANDGTTHALRVLLQRRFGEGGHGFVLAKARTRWYKHKGIKQVSSDGFVVRNFLGGGLPDGAFGYGGVAASASKGQSVRLETVKEGMGSSVSSFELFYRAIGPARIAVTVDGARLADVVIGAKKGDEFKQWTLPDGPHRLRLRIGRGKVRLFGIAAERERGLVYDSLGVVGARASRWLNVRAVHLHEQLRHRRTDLVVFNYGGNSRNDKTSETRYKTKFTKVIKRLRPNAEEACLVIGPSDHGVRKKGKILSDPKTIRLIQWQREVALANDCAFLDARAVMGGEGAMGRWVKRGLGWMDHAHFTPKGMVAMGTAIYAAFLHGTRDYLARSKAPPP